MDIPQNANDGCVGPSSNEAGKAKSCEGCPNQSKCASGESREPDPGKKNIFSRKIEHFEFSMKL